MRGNENNPAVPRWSKSSDSNKLWRALNNIRFFGIKGTALLHENGLNITLTTSAATVAKITVDNADGTYKAVEQIWDGSADVWINKPDGLTFDGADGNEPALREIDELGGVAVDAVVIVTKHIDDEGDAEWLFKASFQDYYTELTGYSATGDFALVVSDGALEWRELGCD